MRLYQIEVDEEVYSYLKTRIQDFGDNPNSVLRRELAIVSRPGRRSGREAPMASEFSNLPHLPFGTPVALEQILQVMHLVHRRELSRSEATHIVAAQHRVAPQTVLDKYTRQLDLTASEFDRYLAEDEVRGLRALLKRKFEQHQSVIDEALA